MKISFSLFKLEIIKFELSKDNSEKNKERDESEEEKEEEQLSSSELSVLIDHKKTLSTSLVVVSTVSGFAGVVITYAKFPNLPPVDQVSFSHLITLVVAVIWLALSIAIVETFRNQRALNRLYKKLLKIRHREETEAKKNQ